MPFSTHTERIVGQWPTIAQQWPLLRSPLRPTPEDIAYLEQAFKKYAKPAPTALILGVTPEICNLNWPAQTQVFAIDQTFNMIKHIWPGHRNAAILANWQTLPINNATADIVCCDGGLHLLPYPHSQDSLIQQLTRVLRPNGVVAIRLFLPPLMHESLDTIFSDLGSGNIPNIHCLKFRLIMALCKIPSEGVALDHVWQTLMSYEPSLDCLANKLGWDIAETQTIYAYKDNFARYYPVSLQEVCKMFVDASQMQLRLCDVFWPNYPMGQQCPTVLFQKII